MTIPKKRLSPWNRNDPYSLEWRTVQGKRMQAVMNLQTARFQDHTLQGWPRTPHTPQVAEIISDVSPKKVPWQQQCDCDSMFAVRGKAPMGCMPIRANCWKSVTGLKRIPHCIQGWTVEPAWVPACGEESGGRISNPVPMRRGHRTGGPTQCLAAAAATGADAP